MSFKLIVNASVIIYIISICHHFRPRLAQPKYLLPQKPTKYHTTNFLRNNTAALNNKLRLQCNNSRNDCNPLHVNLIITSSFILDSLFDNINLCSFAAIVYQYYIILFRVAINMEYRIQPFESAANIGPRQPPAPLPPRANEVTSNGIIYRVDEPLFQKQMLVNALVCIGWTGVMMVCILMAFVDLAQSSLPPALLPFAGASLCAFSLFILSLFKLKTLSAPMNLTIASTALYLITATTMLATDCNQQWLAAVLYAAVEIIICLLFAENKRNVVLVALTGLQLTLIALKVDGVITAEWAAVFLIFIITALTMVLAALVLAVYGFVLRLKQGRFTADVVGVFYEAVFLLSLGLCLATVVCRVAFLSTSIYLCAPCIAYHIFAILRFMYPFRQDIAIYKAQGEIVSIMGRHAAIDKVQRQTPLYMLSSQWFTLQQRNPKRSQGQICSEERQSQCVVCLAERANLVWMPCGHLSMCTSCGEYMMKNQKLDCVMCKAKAEEIYHLQEKSGEKEYWCSDYHYRIRII